ncbi:MAG: hypothetical protein GY719_25955 [bacterium]|nr:hypothetical protein [bacterium]
MRYFIPILLLALCALPAAAQLGPPEASDTVVTGSWDFSAGQCRMPQASTCAATDCDAADEDGRGCYDTDAASGSRWLMCEFGSGWVTQGAGSFSDIDTDYGAETVTSAWQFVASGAGGLTNYDLSIGDTDGTPTYGVLRIGDSTFGRTSYSGGSLDIGGATMINNIGELDAGNDPGIEVLIIEDVTNTIRLAIPESAAGNATAFIRSGTFAGPSALNNNIVLCDTWTTYDTNIDCDTVSTGADLFVQDDLEVEGTFFLHETINFEGATADGNQVIVGVGADPLGGSVNLTWPTSSGALLANGAQLDLNEQCLGDGTLELLCFSETASAVNEITIANAATGNGPTISTTGEAGVPLNINATMELGATDATDQLILPLSNDAASPTLAFGDGNTGFYEQSDNRLIFASNGAAAWRFRGASLDTGGAGGGAGLLNTSPTATTPTVLFLDNDTNSGLGGTADTPSIIAGGVEGIRVSVDAVTTTGGRYQAVTRVTSSPHAVVGGDHNIFVDTDGGAITVNLPAGVAGRYLRVINVGTGANDATVDGDGGETVRGAATQTVADGEILIIVYETTEGWW